MASDPRRAALNRVAITAHADRTASLNAHNSSLAVCPFSVEELKRFHEFDKYPWDTDATYQRGLQEVCSGPAQPSSKPASANDSQATAAAAPPAGDHNLTSDQLLQLRLHYFTKLGKPIDPVKYARFRQLAADFGPESESSSDGRSSASTSPPADGDKDNDALAAYRYFDNYNFASDQAFQAGLQQVLSEFRAHRPNWADAKDLDAQVLKCQLYYFSKKVRPLNIKGYLAYRKRRDDRNSAAAKCPFAHTWNHGSATARDLDAIFDQQRVGITLQHLFPDYETARAWDPALIRRYIGTVPYLLSEAIYHGARTLIIARRRAWQPKHTAVSAKAPGPPPPREDVYFQPGVDLSDRQADYRRMHKSALAEDRDGPPPTAATARNRFVATGGREAYLATLRNFYVLVDQNIQASGHLSYISMMDGMAHRSMADFISTYRYNIGTENACLCLSPLGDNLFPWLPVSGLYLLSRLGATLGGNYLETMASPEISQPRFGSLSLEDPQDYLNGRQGDPETTSNTTAPPGTASITNNSLAYFLLFYRGLKLRPPEMLQLKILDCFVPAARYDELRRKLCMVGGTTDGGAGDNGGASAATRDIAIRLTYESERAYPGPSRLDAWKPLIEKHLSNVQTAQQLVDAFERIPTAWAQACSQSITENSPLLIRIMMEAVNMAHTLCVEQCDQLEFYIAQQFSLTDDFYTYLNAQVEDVPVAKLKWQHTSLSEVTDEEIDDFFAGFDPGARFERTVLSGPVDSAPEPSLDEKGLAAYLHSQAASTEDDVIAPTWSSPALISLLYIGSVSSPFVAFVTDEQYPVLPGRANLV
ncbi:hypothetical protein IWQ60_005206 [Tieghemiomyces parasiticus]|uniref:3-hydroxyisobutyryl-CoA hydrolase n=1 Tax=Tieghemiomyces parasiticus TaxID=78921 RepID=A0A9W8AEY9_9FUNG|nr:hypothetical protein IWQ60_005206 [Tieghemiomyces parasiticus]